MTLPNDPTTLLRSLNAGDEGYWPVMAAIPRDIRAGDLLEILPDENNTFVGVFEVERVESRLHGARIAIFPVNGDVFTIGAFTRAFDLYRQGKHSTLADSCR